MNSELFQERVNRGKRGWGERLRSTLPRLLDFYIAKQLLAPAAIVLMAFASMLLVQLLLREARVIFSETSTPLAVFDYVLYRLPWFAVLSLPVAMMGATALALARLIRDQELVSIHMGTISLRRVAVPILVVASFVSVLSFVINEKVVPWANAGALKAQGDRVCIAPRVVIGHIELDVRWPGPALELIHQHMYDYNDAGRPSGLFGDSPTPDHGATP